MIRGDSWLFWSRVAKFAAIAGAVAVAFFCLTLIALGALITLLVTHL